MTIKKSWLAAVVVCTYFTSCATVKKERPQQLNVGNQPRLLRKWGVFLITFYKKTSTPLDESIM
jgi:hypothetical protein